MDVSVKIYSNIYDVLLFIGKKTMMA